MPWAWLSQSTSNSSLKQWMLPSKEGGLHHLTKPWTTGTHLPKVPIQHELHELHSASHHQPTRPPTAINDLTRIPTKSVRSTRETKIKHAYGTGRSDKFRNESHGQ
jgi:hypothetical protein